MLSAWYNSDASVSSKHGINESSRLSLDETAYFERYFFKNCGLLSKFQIKKLYISYFALWPSAVCTCTLETSCEFNFFTCIAFRGMLHLCVLWMLCWKGTEDFLICSNQRQLSSQWECLLAWGWAVISYQRVLCCWARWCLPITKSYRVTWSFAFKINHLLSYLHSTFTVCKKETKWGFFCGDMGAKGLCYAVSQLLMPVTELQGYLTTTSTIWQWKLISVLLKTMLLFTKESNPYFLFLPSKKLLNFFL